jgi:hypothetical protein
MVKIKLLSKKKAKEAPQKGSKKCLDCGYVYPDNFVRCPNPIHEEYESDNFG